MYGALFVLSLVCAALWFTNVVEIDTGLGRLGNFIFPVGSLFFGVRLGREVRSSEPSFGLTRLRIDQERWPDGSFMK